MASEASGDGDRNQQLCPFGSCDFGSAPGPRQCPETFALPGERRSYPVTAPRGPRAQGSHPLSDFSPDLGFFRGGLRRR